MAEFTPSDFIGHVDDFIELRKTTAQIEKQNAQYLRHGAIEGSKDNPYANIHAQNRDADAQSRFIEELGALVELLPYEELSRYCIEVERELASCLERLETIDSEDCLEKVAVRAMAFKIMEECFPNSRYMQQKAEEGAARENERINNEHRATLMQRIIELKTNFDQLSWVMEAIGSQSPARQAFHQDVPVEDKDSYKLITPIPTGPAEQNGNGKIHLSPVIETTNGIVEEISEPDVVISIDSNILLSSERATPEQEVSQRIAELVCAMSPDDVTVEEFLSYIYGDSGKNRSLITSALGPEVKGKLVEAMVVELGYRLERDWLKVKEPGKDGRMQTKRLRVYRATPIIKKADNRREVSGFLDFDDDIEGEEPGTSSIDIAA